jgi:segregation and condensation protein B
VRGVNVDGVMRTLLSRGLVEEAGRDGEHGATLYRTTTYFLERIGIVSLDELPDLAPHLPDLAEVEEELRESVAEPVAADDDEPAPVAAGAEETDDDA